MNTCVIILLSAFCALLLVALVVLVCLGFVLHRDARHLLRKMEEL